MEKQVINYNRKIEHNKLFKPNTLRIRKTHNTKA